MEPESMFCLRWIICSDDMVHGVTGIVPLNRLLLAYNSRSLGKNQNHDGNTPEKEFDPKLTTCNRRKEANSLGREPWKLLFSKDKWERNDRFPTCGAMVPVRPMCERFKAVTLRCLAPQVMPIQLQTEVEVDQLVAKNLWGSSVIWALRARRADWSVVMLVLTATAKLTIKQCNNSNAKKRKKAEFSMSFYLYVGWDARLL